MKSISRDFGIGRLMIHRGEGENPHDAHITPIYQTSTDAFPWPKPGLACQFQKILS